jgi:hypothetical protein
VSKSVAIVQSNYIPWKGYFDLISQVDEFILYDDVQYTRRDWRNRNLIKTDHGLKWLTIPVLVRGLYYQKIKDVVISDPGWGKEHWSTIQQYYGRAPYFRQYREAFEQLYCASDEMRLSQVNYQFLAAICSMLGITTPLSWSMSYELPEGKTERLVDLCRQVGASTYLSGPAAQVYLDVAQFEAVGIEVKFASYNHYPEYSQLYPPFEHRVSILDLLFNTGPAAREYLTSS